VAAGSRPLAGGIETHRAIFFRSQGFLYSDFSYLRRCLWHPIIFPTGGVLH
jgi:hypothetical protein